jgi:hypothetical protein
VEDTGSTLPAESCCEQSSAVGRQARRAAAEYLAAVGNSWEQLRPTGWPGQLSAGQHTGTFPQCLKQRSVSMLLLFREILSIAIFFLDRNYYVR